MSCFLSGSAAGSSTPQIVIVQESSKTVFDVANKASHSADYQFELPLVSLAPGQYLLTIEASRKEKQTAHRDVVFSVR